MNWRFCLAFFLAVFSLFGWILSQQVTIRFEGLRIVSVVDLTPHTHRFPMAWQWWFLRIKILAGIEQHPLVKQASVSTCKLWTPACFLLRVEERRPHYVVAGASQRWLLDHDLSFLAPVSPEYLGQGEFVIQLQDVSVPHPEKERARLSRLLQARFTIEKILSDTIVWLSSPEPSVMQVRFERYPFVATFHTDLERAAEESRKLRELLSQLGERAMGLTSIDLAIKGIAVITPPLVKELPTPEPKVGK